MRRLRGEQFCSVEHLDSFTAQQAELALERLAASVDEKPATSRPAPVLKRLSRELTAEEALVLQPLAPEPATPELRPLADAVNQNGAAFEARSEPRLDAKAAIEDVNQDSEQAFSRLTEAFALAPAPREAAPQAPAAPPLAPTVSPRPVPEYPLAAFVAGVEVSPRAPMTQARLESFAPVESWGKSTYPSAMPQLRTQPAELGEIRTWDAGQLASKVPPPAPSREFLAGKMPAYAGPRSSMIEPETLNVVDTHPQLPALAAQVDEIKAEWSGCDSQRMLSLMSGFRFQPLQLSTDAILVELQAEEFQGTVRQPEYRWTPSGVTAIPEYAAARTGAQALAGASLGEFTPALEGFYKSATRPAHHWAPEVSAAPEHAMARTGAQALAGASLGEFTPAIEGFYKSATQPAHHWTPSAANVLPEHASLRNIARLPMSGSLVSETNGLEYVIPEGRPAEFDGAAPEIGWAVAVPMRETWRSCPPPPVANSFVLDLAAFDAEFVPSGVTLPAPPAWTFSQKFEAASVQMPMWQIAPALSVARPMLSLTREGDNSAEFSNTVAMPHLPGTTLTVGRLGASFGWEHESARVGVGPETCSAEAPVSGNTPVELARLQAKLGVAPSRTPLIVPEAHAALVGEDIALLREIGATEPAGSTPRYDDFRARVRTGLPPGDRRGYGEWAQPRYDHSMIVTEPIAASRPALAEVHADMEQPYRLAAASFETIRAVATPIEACSAGVTQVMTLEGATCEIATAWPRFVGPVTALTAGSLLAVRGTVAPGTFAEQVRIAGPARYSPVTLVVVPPPQFALIKGTPAIEERFAAQVPLNSRAPRVRHTGFRLGGPFPKLPPCMPERAFVLKTPEFAPPLKDVPRLALEQRQDLTGMPEFSISGKLHLHPADYWAWPSIKVPKSSRVAADVAVAEPPVSSPVRRFGPERAGLQTNLKSADGPRKGA